MSLAPDSARERIINHIQNQIRNVIRNNIVDITQNLINYYNNLTTTPDGRRTLEAFHRGDLSMRRFVRRYFEAYSRFEVDENIVSIVARYIRDHLIDSVSGNYIYNQITPPEVGALIMEIEDYINTMRLPDDVRRSIEDFAERVVNSHATHFENIRNRVFRYADISSAIDQVQTYLKDMRILGRGDRLTADQRRQLRDDLRRILRQRGMDHLPGIISPATNLNDLRRGRLIHLVRRGKVFPLLSKRLKGPRIFRRIFRSGGKYYHYTL